MKLGENIDAKIEIFTKTNILVQYTVCVFGALYKRIKPILLTSAAKLSVSWLQNIFPLANSLAEGKMLGAVRHPTGP